LIKLQLDQGICVPRPNIQVRCNPEENALSRIPPDAIWVQAMGKMGECRYIFLSMSNLMEQVQRTGSGYVMISGSFKYPGLLRLPSLLQKSGAFEIVHGEGSVGTIQGVVLLKSTGRTPEAVPTLMNSNTLINVRRCEQAKGPDYAQRIRDMFPNGVINASG
jgi:hypothetical protein